MGSHLVKGTFADTAIPKNLSDIKVKDIRGCERSLSEWDGKVKLVVNVASKCGLTKAHTAELIELRQRFGTEAFEVVVLLQRELYWRPLALASEHAFQMIHNTLLQNATQQISDILGFPCSQFASQEYQHASDTEAFCERSKIDFPIFETSDVNGPSTNPVFLYCKANSDEFYTKPAGQCSVRLSNIGWNYGKFLLDKRNGVYKYYGPRIEAKKLADDIGKLISGELRGMKRDANGDLQFS